MHYDFAYVAPTYYLYSTKTNLFSAVEHIWISGRLNMTKDVNTDGIAYLWYNPINSKRIPDPKNFGDSTIGVYVSTISEFIFNVMYGTLVIFLYKELLVAHPICTT